MFARLLACSIAMLLVSCGTPGAPQPPSLRLPRPIEDLRAVRKGDKVFLTWTASQETTDRGGIRGAATARICRSYRTQTSACSDPVGDVSSPPGQKASFTDDLTNSLRNPAQDFVTYNVEVLNDLGRSAGPSNAVTIFLAPSMAAPQDVAAHLDKDGITLEWTGAAPPPSSSLRTNYFYRVLRAVLAAGEGDVPESTVGEVPAQPGRASVRDRNFIWERRYVYGVAGVTQVLSRDGKVLAEFEGQAAKTGEVFAHDIYAPEAPQGLQAVYSGIETQRSIDLTWTSSEESDLAGYHVYRREGTSDGVRISQELVKTPSYRDGDVRPGKEYFYTVAAVDSRGNESKASAPTSEKVPE